MSKKVEFVKPETDLSSVTFTPSKFGIFLITTFGVGFGFGLEFNQHLVLGFFTWIISIIGLLWSFSTRSKY